MRFANKLGKSWGRYQHMVTDIIEVDISDNFPVTAKILGRRISVQLLRIHFAFFEIINSTSAVGAGDAAASVN